MENYLECNTTILALDLGSKTGWAVSMKDSKGEQKIDSGTINFKQKRIQSVGVTFLNFKRWLTEIKNLYGGFSYIYFEEVRRHKGTAAAHSYGGYVAHLTAWCERHSIEYESVPVGVIKKHVTGKGNASKQDVIDAVRAKGYAPYDDNEADAQGLLDYVLTNYHNDQLREVQTC